MVYKKVRPTFRRGGPIRNTTHIMKFFLPQDKCCGATGIKQKAGKYLKVLHGGTIFRGVYRRALSRELMSLTVPVPVLLTLEVQGM